MVLVTFRRAGADHVAPSSRLVVTTVVQSGGKGSGGATQKLRSLVLSHPAAVRFAVCAGALTQARHSVMFALSQPVAVSACAHASPCGSRGSGGRCDRCGRCGRCEVKTMRVRVRALYRACGDPQPSTSLGAVHVAPSSLLRTTLMDGSCAVALRSACAKTKRWRSVRRIAGPQ